MPFGPLNVAATARPAVAGVAGCAGSGDPLQPAAATSNPKDRVAFPQHQIDIAVGIGVERSRTVERRPLDRPFVGRRAACPGAGERRDVPVRMSIRRTRLLPMSQTSRLPVRVERDAVRLAELRADRRTAVAAEARFAGAGDRRDDAGARVDAADDVVVALDDVEVAVAIEPQFVWRGERPTAAGPPSPAYPFSPVPAIVVMVRLRRSRRRTRPVSNSQKYERAVRSDDDAVRIGDRRLAARPRRSATYPGFPVPASVRTRFCCARSVRAVSSDGARRLKELPARRHEHGATLLLFVLKAHFCYSARARAGFAAREPPVCAAGPIT